MVRIAIRYVKIHFLECDKDSDYMMGEVSMDLIQPSLMSRIVDDGVLGLNNNGVGNLHLILTLGLSMIVLVIFGGLSGSLNNMFVHMSSQNIGNEMRKDCFGEKCRPDSSTE